MIFSRSTRTNLLITIAALGSLLYVINIREIDFFSYFRHRRKAYTTSLYTINTTGCKIPYLEIDDEEIVNLLHEIDSYSCSDKPPLIESNLTSLYVNESVLKNYGVNSVNEIKCFYKSFERVVPKELEEDHIVKYGEPIHFISSINITDEFVRVECSYNGRKYIDYHSFIPLKPTEYDTKRNPSDNKLNIIMVGIDTLSRLHLQRKMPKTVRYLKEKLGAIEFKGYNKLADNTFPNLMPMFTNYNFDEIRKQCWPNYNTKFDNCSFVWQNYSRSGYVTSFAEERSFFGLFMYLKKGFFKQPTDYYFDTFDYEASEQIGHWYDLFRTYPMCMGPRPMYQVLLTNSEKFIKTMKDQRFFTFYWVTTLAHENINTATLGDEDYVNHLKFLNDSGVLNNSILIFLSDHGYRYGPMSRTHQGHLEDRLPYIYWVFPSWFKNKYKLAMDNLKNNGFRLTTPFDVFATLNHLLHPEQLSDDVVGSIGESNERSVSFFHPISPKRTCDSAGIPPHWCTCQEFIPIEKTDKIVIEIATFTTEYLNGLLKPYEDCVNLTLHEITSASLAKSGDNYRSVVETISDYSVSFKTMPGGAWFDATVRCTFCKASDFKITGTVSRLNMYGNQSACIKDFNLRLYCYCKNYSA